MKKLLINGEFKSLPEDIKTVSQLQEYLDIPDTGTAIAVNNFIVKTADWKTKLIEDNDTITIIRAAFGG